MLKKLFEQIDMEVACQHIKCKNELKNFIAGYLMGVIDQKVNEFGGIHENDLDELLKVVDQSTGLYSAVSALQSVLE